MTPIEWVLSDDAGASSKTIFAVMVGSSLSTLIPPLTPSDPDDFGRCYRLLKHFPGWRGRLPEVANQFPAWGPLVDAWDELTTLYEACCEPDGQYTQASYRANKEAARKLYDRMCELNEDGMLADGWAKERNGCWRRNYSQRTTGMKG